MTEENKEYKGSCLCGGVQYTAVGPLDDVVACHCRQCQKTSGFHVAMTRLPLKNLRLDKYETLNWYRSSNEAERGFCTRCGGNVFWKPTGKDSVSITAGTLDQPTGLKLRDNIYTEFAGDYYEIPKVTR
ncbi:GFA family protein [Hwanghaeella grinnelliae]|uniref:GFA family protein n=1 Tax=Hwanghaeella grinnelliae TaxID=2500179 RepID=A0A3S2Y4Q7_9PROT|nr:GFA family protein [Hwanghaeella grinnelliae]RVU38504.1 GFA family protein [Hwanghaeella grinnelliae]